MNSEVNKSDDEVLINYQDFDNLTSGTRFS